MTADTSATTGEQGQAEGQAEGDEQGGCRLCEVVPAVLGLLAAAVIIFVSADLLTGGRLTVTALRIAGAGKAGPGDQSGSQPADG